jgi:hypothetical protein
VRLGTHASTLDQHTQTFLTAAKQQSFIPRRRTLLNFIDAKPKDRYTAIEAFLKLDQFTAFEAHLKHMVSNAEAETRKIEEERRRHEAALRERLNLKPDEQVNVAKCVEHANKAITKCRLGLSSLLERFRHV